MNTILNAIDLEGEIYQISVDMQLYKVEEYTDETCLISHKTIEGKEYEVIHNFNNFTCYPVDLIPVH